MPRRFGTANLGGLPVFTAPPDFQFEPTPAPQSRPSDLSLPSKQDPTSDQNEANASSTGLSFVNPTDHAAVRMNEKKALPIEQVGYTTGTEIKAVEPRVMLPAIPTTTTFAPLEKEDITACEINKVVPRLISTTQIELEPEGSTLMARRATKFAAKSSQDTNTVGAQVITLQKSPKPKKVTKQQSEVVGKKRKRPDALSKVSITVAEEKALSEPASPATPAEQKQKRL